MAHPFAVFHDSPLPSTVSQPQPGQRSYVLPLALETLPPGVAPLEELKTALDHLEAHAAFLRVQVWVHTLLSLWSEQLPLVERFGIVLEGDTVTQTPHTISKWEGWFTQGDIHLGVRANGELDTVSELRSLSAGVSAESLKRFSQVFVRQVLSVPLGREGGYLMGELLLSGGEVQGRMRQGWTREEWGQRLASLNLHPEVFGEARAHCLETALPSPSVPRKAGPRF